MGGGTRIRTPIDIEQYTIEGPRRPVFWFIFGLWTLNIVRPRALKNYLNPGSSLWGLIIDLILPRNGGCSGTGCPTSAVFASCYCNSSSCCRWTSSWCRRVEFSFCDDRRCSGPHQLQRTDVCLFFYILARAAGHPISTYAYLEYLSSAYNNVLRQDEIYWY